MNYFKSGIRHKIFILKYIPSRSCFHRKNLFAPKAVLLHFSGAKIGFNTETDLMLV